MGQEIVTMIVDGVRHTNWKSMSVKYSAQSPERSFQIVAADEAPDLISAAWSFQPGTEVELYANQTLLVAGYINDLSISIDAETHDLRLSGRCKGQDCVDCSVNHGTHQWRGKALDAILNDTGSNTRFRTDEVLKPITVARANPGEPVFMLADRLARKQGLFLKAEADGTVLITKHGKNRHDGAIVEGFNMLKGEATFSDRDRHAEVKVKAQNGTGTGEASTQKEGVAKDEGARSGRSKAFLPDQNLDKSEAQTQADTIKSTRQGLSVKSTMVTQGFRDEGGNVWETGWLIYCQSTMLHLAQDMAIESVSLSQSGDRTISTLSLVDPKALGGKGGGKSRSGSAWS